MKIENYKLKICLLLIICIGAFFRFYKLDWGNGLFTHPDEYHIVGSVDQLSFPNQMNPHFFSYGTVIIYTIYFTKELILFINSHNSLFLIPNSLFLIGRFYSAFFSTFTILIMYYISRFFLNKHFSLLPTFLVAITPGLIQQAHFATPESILIFFVFGSLLFLLSYVKYKRRHFLFLASVFLGFALGVKISSLIFLAPLIAGVILSECHSRESRRYPEGHGNPESRLRIKSAMTIIKHEITILRLVITSTTISLITFAIVDPFVFLDFSAFRGNLEYEGNLAAGNIPVFYTRQFIQTTPVLFQIEKIFPYTLGLPILIAGLAGFFLSITHLGWWRGNDLDSSEVNSRAELLILIIAFLSLFIPNAFLLAKWTRFISPIFPFFAIFASFFIFFIRKNNKYLSNACMVILLLGTILWTSAFFSIYTNADIRITASKWLVANTPSRSVILIEGGNMIDIPLEGNFNRIGFDFYTFENDPLTRLKIAKGLEQANYFLVQSRRVFLNHQRARKQFPKTAHFYDMLFAGKLGFEEIKEFHRYPSLSLGNFSLEVPDEQAEETWSVFDHPVIRIFKKNAKLSKEDYAKIFEEQ